MKRINNEYILSLKPCEDRKNNYLKHYKNTDFSVVEFLKLDNITYDDKIWVWKKFATINEAAIFGLKCASSVLYIFEKEYPLDKRPRLALKAVEAFINNPTDENKELCGDAAAHAAHAAAYDAAYDAAAYSANAAAYAADAAAYAADAAAYAADAAAHAAYAVADAAAYAADAAAYSAAANAAADAAKIQQQEINLMFLIKIYEENEVKK